MQMDDMIRTVPGLAAILDASVRAGQIFPLHISFPLWKEQYACAFFEENHMICENVKNLAGRLQFAGHDVGALARQYGTPAYFLDEQRIRKNCRMYKHAMNAGFEKALPLYASKALCCRRVLEIVAEEGLGIDVVSAGELYMARLAGVRMDRTFFHGCSKSDAEIYYGVENGVGYFIVDGEDELLALARIAGEKGVRQKVLLRLTPGIDPHTFEAVATGQLDSKFGVPIETGQAEAFLCLALSLPDIEVCGYHAHVGSQVFESSVFRDTADAMLAFVCLMRDKLGFMPGILNLGGGYGVRYVESDPHVDIAWEISKVAGYIRRCCAQLGMPVPAILMEPGRSIVADAGLTAYTVEAVKRIPGSRDYLCVDGGMADNPRYALYGAAYTVLAPEHMDAPRDFICTIGGHCCESGDMIQENVPMPRLSRGDLVAVLTTGAYNHSMASNYNNVPRPPVVMLDGARTYIAVRRETYGDMASREQ